MLSTLFVAGMLTAALNTSDDSATQAAKSVWHADYATALAETRQADQPLLVVLDMPKDESKRLDPNLLTAEGGAFPLDSYALCHIDVTTDYGKKVAEGFKVTEFPHVAIIDKSGSVILQRVSGDITKSDWKKALTRHESGLSTGQRYTAAKPVVTEPTTSTVISSPVTSSPVVSQPAATYTPSFPAVSSYPTYSAPQPYCPSCQRNR